VLQFVYSDGGFLADLVEQCAGSLGVIDVFHRTFDGVPFQQFTAAGTQVTATYGASSSGVNFEGHWEPIRHLTFDLTGDWQRDLYTNYSSATSGGASYTGLYLARQPRLS